MRSTIDPLLIPLVWVSIQQFFKLVWKTDYNDQSKQRLTSSLAHEKPEFLEARKRGWPSGGWFSFCVWLVERMERFLSQGAVEPKQTQIALNTSIEISLFKQHNYLTNLFVIHQDQCGKRITSSCVGLQDFSVYIFVRISETITPPKSQ